MKDKKKTKEVMSLKSGKFVFSLNYDCELLLPLFLEAEFLKQFVAETPILPV